jgi:hypothetical protein
MLVKEALAKIKERKPNAYSDEALLDYINECEAMVQRELYLETPEEIVQYEYPDGLEKELILPSPYSMVYVTYAIMMIQYNQEEISAYNNSNAMFETQLAEAQKYYNRHNENRKTIRVTNWFC